MLFISPNNTQCSLLEHCHCLSPGTTNHLEVKSLTLCWSLLPGPLELTTRQAETIINNNRQPLWHMKYDAIMIIKGLLTPWQEVAIQVFSPDGEGEGEPPPLQVISPPRQVISPPLLPHYIREETWSPHNRQHLSNIITVASWQNTFISIFYSPADLNRVLLSTNTQ